MATYVCRECSDCHKKSVIPERGEQTCKECGGHSFIEPVSVTERSPRIQVPGKGWNLENGGKGHYCSYLESGPSTGKSKNAYVGSVTEMKEKLSAMGLKAVRDG